MRIDLVFPALPPALDGIGDHTAHLADALSAHAEVRVLTAQPDARPIPGVVVEQAFSNERRRGVHGLLEAVAARPPDWLVLQFNQFSYGRWGLNPYLPRVLRRLQRMHPAMRVAVLFHEDFVPRSTLKFAVMSTWQRRQFRQLGATADRVFFTIGYWTDRYRRWFPDTPVACLPVGSNVPLLDEPKVSVRDALGLSPATFVIGYFGSLHNSRLPHLVRGAVERIGSRTDYAVVLYIGTDGEALRQHLGDLPFHDAGRLPAAEVSRHLHAVDLYLAPFLDGVSTRRGSFMASLQHGLPTVATRGPHTDAVLGAADGTALLLAGEDDPDGFARQAVRLHADATLRSTLGSAGQRLYRTHFDWPVLARRLTRLLNETDEDASPNPVPRCSTSELSVPTAP